MLFTCINFGYAGHKDSTALQKMLLDYPVDKKSKMAISNLDITTYDDLKEIEAQIEIAPDEAIKELDRIVKIAIKENLHGSVTFAYNLLGRAYKELHQPQLALHFMKLAEDSYGAGKLKKLIKVSTRYEIPAIYYLDLAEIYIQLGDYSKSIDHFIIYKGIEKNSAKIEEADYAIAQNLYALKEFEKAIELYEKILSIETKAGNYLQKQLCYSRLAACYISLGNTEKGLSYYNLSMPGANDANIIDQFSQFNENQKIVTDALRKQNLTSIELDIRNAALQFVDNGLENLKLAQAYYRDNNFSKTISSLDEYFKNISYNLIDLNEIAVINKVALELQKRNEPNKALVYLLRFNELSDTINNRLATLEQRSKMLGATGYQNILELEVLQKDVEMSENTIYHLMRESELKENLVGFQKILISLLSAVLLIGLAALIYIIRVSKQRRIANQQLALRSLRSQMNPHFIFNALNSVNSFISMSDEKSANKFLTEFSTLMRTVMENAEHDFISLSKELETIKIYIELEHFRFKDKFSYHLNIDEDLDEDAIVLPTMIIQPYVENAIWHGLRYLKASGELTIELSKEKNDLKIIIKDNGIGRAKSEELKTKNQKKNKSIALKNIGERIKLFNSLHKVNIKVTTDNLHEDGSGTVVTILIPQPKNG